MIDTLHKKIVEFTAHIVRIASMSGQEGELAAAVAVAMKELKYDEVWVDDFGNVIGKRVGTKPGRRVLFDAHMDNVPVTDPEQWKHAPFGGEISGGRIWGRGSTDTKGSLAGMVVGIGSLPEDEIHGTIFVSGTVNEEVFEGGGLEKVAEIVKPEMVVIGEPNECNLGIGQRGRAGILFTQHGIAAHSATPYHGDNAVYTAEKAIQMFRNMEMPGSRWLGNGLLELIDIASKPLPSLSTVPYECNIHYDRRLVETESQESVISGMREILGDHENYDLDYKQVLYKTYTGKEITLPDFHPAWYTSEDSLIVKWSNSVLNSAGFRPEKLIIPFCTNGSSSAGILKIPTIVFGPSSIHLAHITDEYIEINELTRGMDGYIALARELGRS